jgi:hypothetical protein
MSETRRRGRWMTQKRLENASFPVWGEVSSPVASPANAIDGYRARAARLWALAAESSDPEVRTYLLTTAAQFERLADYAAASGSSTHAA